MAYVITQPDLISSRDIQAIYPTASRQQVRGRISERPLPCPFTIAIDTREQFPFDFTTLRANSDRSYRPFIIDTHRCTLRQGDYSIVGHELQIALERKSKIDLFGTLSAGRERFENELERLSQDVSWSAVIVEAEWSDIMESPPEFSQLNPKSVEGAVVAFMVRYPKVHWMFMPGRRAAEERCFKMLERYWKELEKREEGE